MAIIPACHAGDPSSILGCGGFYIFFYHMEIEETDQARLTQSTQLIESHSEYLTLVRSLASHKARTQNTTYRTLESYMENYA